MKFTIKPKSNYRIKEDMTITIYTLELPYRDNQKNISCIPGNSMNNNINNPNIAFLLYKNLLKNIEE